MPAPLLQICREEGQSIGRGCKILPLRLLVETAAALPNLFSKFIEDWAECIGKRLRLIDAAIFPGVVS